MALMLAVLASGAQARSAAFQPLAPSPARLSSVTADPTTGLVYAQDTGTLSTGFFVYNPRTNVWNELAPAPLESSNDGGAAYLNGRIYITYTSNGSEISVYDIASNTWTTLPSPLGEGTADITAANGKLYLAVEEEFVSYDPATGITVPLANPPSFEEHGFQRWGALQYDGSGKIYGHQGNGRSGFAVYDIAADTWTELPPIPEIEGSSNGAVAGAAFDPITGTYLAYGGYGEEHLYRFDTDSGTWSVGTLPFTVEDGGMAYVSLNGFEGVYMVEGEIGTAFTRYTEQNETDLSTSMSASASNSATGGSISYSIKVKNNGPERAGGVVLSDSLPAGASLVSASTSAGACSAGSTVTCAIGVLRSGASADLTIRVTTGFGTFTNTAKVSSKALDLNTSNDSATATTTFAPPPALVLPAPKCVVPKLNGLKVKGAKKALRAAHCAPGKVTHRNSHKVKRGRVIRGAKAKGASLPAGTKVNLTVSRGAKPKAHGKKKHAHKM